MKIIPWTVNDKARIDSLRNQSAWMVSSLIYPIFFSRFEAPKKNILTMHLSLEGKNAVICGSSQGIGLAIAEELALLGANCTLLARNEDRIEDGRANARYRFTSAARIPCCRFQ